MRKIILFILFIALSGSVAFSQSVPQGMRYQAVARDDAGKTIDNEKISLQISLRAGEKGDILFTERHEVVTNQLGLFSITIGEGKTIKGEFASIPWSLANIWLDIDMNEAGGKNFTNINSSQLLTVPYAFHAGTAANYSGLEDPTQKNGLQFYWSTTGNLMTIPGTHYVGTRDYKDFIFKTNNLQRMNITKDGDIDIDGSLDVGINLNVGNNVFIGNDLRVERDGSFGRDLLVERNGQFEGNLEVDGTLGVDGMTTLRNPAESTTMDNGSLIVEGGVGIEKNVNIGGNTEIDGTLGVDGVSTFKNTTESTNKDNGSVVVEGGVGIEKNVNIGGNTEVDGTLGVDGVTTLKNTTESTMKDNGSLVVEGGVGIEKNLNVGGNSDVTGNSTIGGTLGVNGITTFNNTTQSTTKDNGAVIIEGGVGIEKNINVGGNSVITGSSTVNGTSGLNGQVTINASVGGGEGSYAAYPLRVQGSSQGIAVQVASGSPNSSNNFITFFNSGSSAIGRIEGQNAADVLTSPEYIFETSILTAEIVAAAANIVLSLLPNGCAGVGVVACPPEPSVVAITIADEILALANQAAYQAFAFANLGVSYQSGSADYAEYLERLYQSESMTPGDIVSVTGGRISKQTFNSSQLLVISTSPAVLGNMQSSADVARFEKVAFMGQVPVKVRGQVNIGDYIIPSGLNDGTGIGVSPDQISANQYKLIVGVAWSATSVDNRVTLINLAIGLNTNDVARVVEEQQKQISNLEQSFAQLEARVIAMESGKPLNAPIVINSTPAMSQLEFLDSQIPESLDLEQIENAIMLLQDTYRSQGLDVDNHVGLKKLFTDATFRKDVIRKVEENYRLSRNNILQMEARRN